MKSIAEKAGTMILILLALIIILPLVIAICDTGRVYETNDVGDYGNYTGNYNNEKPREFITSFFPAELSDTYTDVEYHYKAKRFDTYAYEAYLEFVIPDTAEFDLFLELYIPEDQCKPFLFDHSYMEYSISNVVMLDPEKNKSGGFAIHYAEIGKVLFSEEEQRVIFFALGDYDGGGTDTAELGYFFTRFDIDEKEYQDHAYYTHQDQEKGILFKNRK